MPQRHRRLIAAATVLAALAALAPVAAGAAPIDDKRAEAARLQAQVDANGRRIAQLAEQHNGARWRLDQAQAQLVAAQARIAETEREHERIRRLVTARAAALYKAAGNGGGLDVLDADGFSELSSRTKYSSVAASRDDATMLQLVKSAEALEAEKAALEQAKESALSEQRQIAESRRQIEAANAEQAKLLDKAKGELAALVKEEADRKAREEAARAREEQARRAAAAGAARAGSSFVPANLPAPSGRAAAAVAFAMAQIGKPYRYAASGPDAYDCSGLTMAAWSAAGVSMPHYSGAQARMFPRVPDDQLAPGDLLLSYSDLSHVGMYIGNGLMVHAPQTGDVVKVAPAFRSAYQFAVRPS